MSRVLDAVAMIFIGLLFVCVVAIVAGLSWLMLVLAYCGAMVGAPWLLTLLCFAAALCGLAGVGVLLLSAGTALTMLWNSLEAA